MNMTREKILLMAEDEMSAFVNDSIQRFSGLEILEAKTANKAFELIYNHNLVLVIIDEAHPGVDPYHIGSMLLSHRRVHDTPLLIITEKINDNSFFSNFQNLQVDYILKPFFAEHLCAKIKIMFELFKQKKAVTQSIEELDQVFKKLAAAHANAVSEGDGLKFLSNKSTIAANQIQQSLRNINGSLYQVLREKKLNPGVKSRLSNIRTAAEQISLTTKTLVSRVVSAKENLQERDFHFLYIQDSNNDFKIFSHAVQSVARCRIQQAQTLAEGLDLAAEEEFDLIFIDLMFSECSGFEVLTRLNRMRSTVPVIFTIDRNFAGLGPKSISKGAFTYLIKEEISGSQILGIIRDTIENADLSRRIESARNRIITLSRKDHLTKLYNRDCFEEAVESEIKKSKRYKTALSIVLLDFDRFNAIRDAHGPRGCDHVLAHSASIIQGMARTSDMVCRYGNKKFGIVLTNTPLKGARMFAERLRRTLKAHDFISEQNRFNLTVSLGVAAFDGVNKTTHIDIIRQGLYALSTAANKGGDTVITNKNEDK